MTIHVSPRGDHQNPGTEALPLKSLPQAQTAVRRALSDPQFDGDIRVLLHPGDYRLEETLVFGLEDGTSDPERPVVWQAAEPGTARISTALPLSGWQRLVEEPKHLNTAARGKVWWLCLPPNSHPHCLFRKHVVVSRARGPGFSPTDGALGLTLTCDAFHFPEGALKAWPDVQEAELVVVPKNPWTMNILPVAEVDETKRFARLSQPCSYPIDVPSNAKSEHSLWVENTLAVLTPNTWVYHRKTRTLFYCTENPRPEEDLAAARLTETIRVEGVLDVPGHRDRLVSGLVFDGLVFEHGNRFPFHGGTGRGIQHDWEMFDAPSCMLRLRGAEHCRVENCVFETSGSSGLRLDMTCWHNSVRNCSFQNLGGCGIVLCGYGPGLKYANRMNEIVGNHIHHIGRDYWHSPGIFVWQSGANCIADNHLHDLPYTGIVCSGRANLNRNPQSECAGTIRWHEVDELLSPGYRQPPWYYGWLIDWWRREPLLHARENLIEYNRIHDVMQVMGDGNGIYISGGGGGNVVRFNLVGPCPSPNMAEGLRCDDDQHQTILHGNVVFGLAGHATGITSKGVNRITNNILAMPLAVPTRGMLSLETGPQNGSVIQRNVILTATAEQAFVWQSRIHGEGRRCLLRDADCDSNLFWCLGDPQAGRRHVDCEQAFGVERHSMAEDPRFRDAQRGDFELLDDSPLGRLGFQPLPLKRMRESLLACGARHRLQANSC